MQFSSLFLLFLATLAEATISHHYEISIQTPDLQLHKWGELSLAPNKPSTVASFSVSDAITEPPLNGCIGIITSGTFQCQSLFRFEEGQNMRATKAIVSPSGDVIQVQLVEGNRTQIIIDVPQVVPHPLLQPKFAERIKKGNKNSKETVRDAWRDAKAQPADPGDENKSFIEKYWIYLIPVGLVIFSNAMGGSAGTGSTSGASSAAS